MQLTHDNLIAACRPGGASVLTVTTQLAPAVGTHGGIAPARYLRGRTSTYAFGTRYLDLGNGPTPATVVTVLGKAASLNKIEAAISQAIVDGEEPLAQTPRIRVSYEGLDPVLDLDLPHRAADGHVRSGQVDGGPVTAHPTFRAARDANNANASALLELSPASLVFGGWDATRRAHGFKFRSALVGETIGVLADQSPQGREIDPRGGARFDTIAPSVRLSGDDLRALRDEQEDELSPGNIERIDKEIKRAGKGTVSAAGLGLGAIPPALEGLGLVSCSSIIRSHVLSFAALRQLRFGLGAEGDVAARALLAAFAINGLVRSFGELSYRADCDLVETERPQALLDQRYGNTAEIDLPEVDGADALLSEAIDAARAAGVRWEGQVLEVTGNPLIAGGIVDEVEED